jgi:phenylacetate-CoA ligase
MTELLSATQYGAWPAVMTGFPAELMALQRQLDATQWWSAARLRDAQFRQLRLLLAHAAREVPFHARRLRDAGIDPDAELTEAAWARLPVLTRHDVQRGGANLHASTPPSLGGITETASGGSTGVPVRVRKTALDNLLWNAIHIREEIWHREEPGGTLARIRGFPAHFTPLQIAAMQSRDGLILPNWGPPTSLLWRTGRIGLVSYMMPIPDQAEFLRRLQPTYLLTNPTNLRLLLSHFRESQQSLQALRAVWTLSEVVDDALREACRATLGCRIVHNYTAGESGYLALQCPDHEHFHVQSEVVLLEVLDAAGQPCPPGEIGRVVVTPLHNFAMPLLRYEIGDEAEFGGPCGCGRGLPVLTRIVGRTLDYVTLASGKQRRVDTGHVAMSKIPAIREFQLIQRSLERIEVLLVVSRPLDDAETQAVHAILIKEVGAEFRFELTYCETIPRTAEGKLRTFISQVPTSR